MSSKTSQRVHHLHLRCTYRDQIRNRHQDSKSWIRYTVRQVQKQIRIRLVKGLQVRSESTLDSSFVFTRSSFSLAYDDHLGWGGGGADGIFVAGITLGFGRKAAMNANIYYSSRFSARFAHAEQP
jgi:hypothetical protein